MATVLALDLGTTYAKASVFEPTGILRGSARIPTPVERPAPGRSELPVEGLHALIGALLRRVEAAAPGSLSTASALTFATQTNSFVLLGEDDSPQTPLVLWSDQRARDLQNQSYQRVDHPTLRATTGVPFLTHEFMVAKLAWFRQFEPQIFARVARIHLISDYLTFWLTGRHVTEAGAAGLTGLLNIHTLDWWPDGCRQLAVPLAWLPQVTRAGTDLGPLLPAVAARLGLPRTCRFVVGCLDQYAGAIGAANVTPGVLSETTGTVLATVRCADRFVTNPSHGVFQGPGFDPGMYYQMVFGSTSANLLEAYRSSLSDRPTFAELDRAAADVAPGADGLRVLGDDQRTILAGRAQAWQRDYSRGHAVRAILEAVAFALADQVQRLCGPHVPSTIDCVGGAAGSRVWLQIKADVLNRSMRPVDCREPTSLGAALLALRATTGTDLGTLAQRIPRTTPPVTADPARHRVYAQLRRQRS